MFITFICTCFIFSQVHAQIISKRTVNTANGVQLTKPLYSTPASLVFVRCRPARYDWGEFISENNGILKVRFFGSWGLTEISSDGKLISSAGNLTARDTFDFVDIYETFYPITDPVNQLQNVQRGVIPRFAFSVNNTPFHYAGYLGYVTADNAIYTMPLSADDSKCSLIFSQNQWTVNCSIPPYYNRGDKATAIFYYTDAHRNFYRAQ